MTYKLPGHYFSAREQLGQLVPARRAPGVLQAGASSPCGCTTAATWASGSAVKLC